MCSARAPAARTLVFRILILLAAMLELWPGPARAQQPMPPGQFDYYLLSLSWSPTWCEHHRADPASREECAKARGIVVHGLWPQNQAGPWPASCRPVDPVPADLARRESAIMPNAALIEHEWAKHGSCTQYGVADYFAAIEQAFAALHLPEGWTHPAAAQATTLAEAKAALEALNPGLGPSMVSFHCTPQGELEEVHVCLDRALHDRPCGADQTDSCPARITLPAANSP